MEQVLLGKETDGRESFDQKMAGDIGYGGAKQLPENPAATAAAEKEPNQAEDESQDN